MNVSTTTTVVHPTLHDRAIRPEFISGSWGARYVRFEQGCWDAFADMHSHPEPFHRKVVQQTSGFIINRWNHAGQPIAPYVRPDRPVTLDPRKRPGKYLLPSTAKHPGQAKLIDTHPKVIARLLEGTDEPIYLCLEGSLKADAIAGTGRLAISTLSVTLWPAPEQLAPWLPILSRARAVYVVPDSDFLRLPDDPPDGEPRFINQMVRFHTDKVVGELQSRHGVCASYAVPPYLRYADALLLGANPDDRMKRGIDDYIADGGDFSRWSTTNPQGLHYYRGLARDWNLPTDGDPTRRADHRDSSLLTYLDKTRERTGTFSVRQTAADLGCCSKTITRAWQSCQDRGLLTVWTGWPLGKGSGNKAHVFRLN
jgi:hypothetical protein